MTHVAHNTGNMEWYTPDHILQFARGMLGGPFDLDPASSEQANRVVGASRFYTKEMNGLALPWEAERLWLNPPYSRGLLAQFIDKLLLERSAFRVKSAALLMNNCTETAACQKVLRHARQVCFLHKRIKFLNQELEPANSPLQGQIIAFFGVYPGVDNNTPDLGVIR
jgi:hypothetical protein